MNKALLKASGIVAIICASFYTFVFVLAHVVIPYEYLANDMRDYAILILFAIFALTSLFGGFLFLHYKDLSDEELKNKRNVILYWSIILLITSSISGLIGFVVYCFSVDDLHFGTKISYIEELKALEKLKDKGYITEDEFTRKKKKILDI
jgi:predicted membrane channel-forming protein YqfA (hemolysin III family)